MDNKRKYFHELSKRQQLRRRKVAKNMNTNESVASTNSVSVASENRLVISDECDNAAITSASVDEINDLSEVPMPTPSYVSAQLAPSPTVYQYSSASTHEHSSNTNFSASLAQWVTHNNITLSSTSKLLKLLKSVTSLNDLHDLPSDARTILKTPALNKNIIPMDNVGSFVHFGLAEGLKRSLKKYYIEKLPLSIKVDFNVDGLPIAKSSGSQFWPILCSIVDRTAYTEPFIVSLFHGYHKPQNLTDFLQNFVIEGKDIFTKGIEINDIHIEVKLRCIICDAPAKSMVSGIKGHTGYFGCSKCTQEGDFIDNRMTFPVIGATLRTDDSFKNRIQAEHHRCTSILEDLPIGMVTSFPLDYMHLVLIGVTKRMLQFFMKGTKNVRIKETKLASENLLGLISQIPREFARKPRSLDELDRWKASELRQFLLYTGPVVLKNILAKDFYYHFLILSVAVRILCDTEYYLSINDYASDMLVWFVKEYSALFGEQYISYNVHNLLHLSADAKRFGVLDDFSAFKYENFMQKIKKKIRTSSKPLQQLTNRLSEESFVDTDPAIKYPIIIYNKKNNCIIKSIEYQHFSVESVHPNNCFRFKDKSVVIVNKIFKDCENDTQIWLEVTKYNTLKPFFMNPFDSRLIGICVLDENDNTEILKSCLSEIKNKIFKISFNNECFVMPMMH